MNNNSEGNTNQKQLGTKEKILSVAFVLIFAVGIIFGAIYAQIDKVICLAIFCGMFGMFGLIGLLQGKGLKGKFIGIVFTIVGLAGVSAAVYIKTESDLSKLKGFINKTFPMAISLIFGITGLAMILITTLKAMNLKKKCTLEILAVCTKVDSRISRKHGSKGHHSTNVYCPTFEFLLDGVHYTARNDMYSNVDKVNEGEEVKLMIDPSNPTTFYRVGANKANAIITVMGVIFVCVCAVTMFLLLNGK